MRSGASASDCRPDMVDIDPESVKRLLRCVDDPTQRNTTAAALSKVAAKAEGAQRPAKLALSCLRLPSIYAQAQAAAPPPSRKLAATQRRGSAAPVGALRRVLPPSAHAPCRAPTSLPGFCVAPPPNLFPRLPPVYPTSRMADDVLLLLSDHARDFVAWLEVDEPLVRAYTACILANIAFLEPGQQRVLEGKGIAPLVRLLKGKEDKKVTLHSTAAVQNLTYKNTACCQEVIDHGGEKALKKLLQHKSDDVQQFAAGALANLQLYRRKADDDAPSGGGAAAGGGGRGSSMSRKVAKILRRKNTGGGAADGSPGGSSAPVPQALQKLSSHAQLDDAAATIQACYRGMKGRKDFERHRQRDGRKKGNRYDVFRVNDVRAELSVLPPAGSARVSGTSRHSAFCSHHQCSLMASTGSARSSSFRTGCMRSRTGAKWTPSASASISRDTVSSDTTSTGSVSTPRAARSAARPCANRSGRACTYTATGGDAGAPAGGGGGGARPSSGARAFHASCIARRTAPAAHSARSPGRYTCAARSPGRPAGSASALRTKSLIASSGTVSSGRHRKPSGPHEASDAARVRQPWPGIHSPSSRAGCPAMRSSPGTCPSISAARKARLGTEVSTPVKCPFS